MYENLKRLLNFKNEKYEFLSTAFIGASTTIAHDFFIVPSDGKIIMVKIIYVVIK